MKQIANELRAIADRLEGSREPEFVSEWREDGFSVETSEYGARRHIAIEDALDMLSMGDTHAKQVAEDAVRWLAFDVDEYADLRSDDPGEVALVREARNNSWGANVVFSHQSYLAPFKLRLIQPDALANKYFEFVDGHGFVFIRNTTPQDYAESYAQSLLDDAVARRKAAAEDVTRPVPYRR